MAAPDFPLSAIFAAIDARNAKDPQNETVAGIPTPRALAYSERMSRRLAVYAPDASPALQVAARAQHLERWRIPRGDYPAGRAGYLRWRRDLGQFHAEQCAGILRDNGCDEALIEQVRALLTKKNLRHDRDTQVLEDVSCLVFIEHYLADFADQHATDKVIAILRKTWGKMSPQGQAAALALALPAGTSQLLIAALGESAKS